ncbi:MAG: phage/plasmid primase, P4 family [Syntrophobacteraceae bacterium]
MTKLSVVTDDGINSIQQEVAAEVEREKEQFQLTEPDTTKPKDIQRALRDGQDGDARLLIQLCHDKLLYDHSSRKWYCWKAHFWEEDLIEDVVGSVDGVIELYKQEVLNQAALRTAAVSSGEKEKEKKAKDGEDALLKRIRQLHTVDGKGSVLTLARAGKDSLGITGNEWDPNPMQLGCRNGVIDLNSGDFRNGRPDDFIKTVCPTEWQGFDASAPVFQQFLNDIFNKDQELIDFLQNLFGYSLTGTCKNHIFPILWGHGRNGKGTLLELFKFVLGDLVGPVAAEMLLRQDKIKQASAPSPEIMALRGRRIAWASEIDEGRQLSIGRLKWLVGGDSLVGREPYGKRDIHFNPTHTLFLLTNHKPQADASEYALWQRVCLIPFTLSFIAEPKEDNERKCNPDLLDDLKKEASGILAWLVAGAVRSQQEGLEIPEVIKAATAEYRSEEDVIGHFIEECCTRNPSYQAKSSDLYKAYQEWCARSGYRPMGIKKLGQKMGQRFTKISQRDGNFYSGLRVATITTDYSEQVTCNHTYLECLE